MLVYASRREDGYLHVMAYSLRTGRASQLTFGLYDDSIPEASSDGTTVVFASSRLHAGGGVHVVDTGIYGVHTWIDANGDIGASDPYYIAGALGTQSYDPAINGDKTAVIWGSGSLLRTVATDAVTGAPVGAETTITQNIGFVAWGADGHTVIAE